MANDLATQNDSLPAVSEEVRAALQAKSADIKSKIGAASSAKKIKADPRAGTLVLGDNEAAEIPMVIVDFTTKRAWYDTPWREGDPYRPPVCYGIHPNPDKMVPHDNVEEIGGEYQSDDCASCPLNQWGSDGKGKACKERRVMMVLPPGADYADDEMWMLDIAPTSMKSFDKFVRDVNEAWSIPPIGAIVNVSLDPNVSHVRFQFSNPIPNPDIEAHIARMPEAETILAELEYTPAEEEEAPPPRRAPARKKAASKKKAKARTKRAQG